MPKLKKKLKSNLVRYRYWVVFASSLLLLFVLVQVVLPLALCHYANKKINEFPGLTGEIGSIQLRFIPGVYFLRDVRLQYAKENEGQILKLPELGLRIYWKSLLKGIIEGEGWLKSPRLTFWTSHREKEKKAHKSMSTKAATWQNQVHDFFPFKINKFAISHGVIRYRDLASKPKINLKMKDLTLELTNLTNREELTDTKLAQLKAQATIFDSGHATLNMSFDLLAKQPTFKLKSAITKVDLKNLNGFLMAYGKFEVDRGEFSLFNEIAAKNGHFVAYAKPIFRHIDVQAWEEKHHPNNKLLILWKNIVGFIFDRFKNKEKDQIAIKIKAEGSFEDPNINILQAVASLLRNGFIQALIPGYDNTIRWNDVPDDNSKEKESGKTPKS